MPGMYLQIGGFRVYCSTVDTEVQELVFAYSSSAARRWKSTAFPFGHNLRMVNASYKASISFQIELSMSIAVYSRVCHNEFRADNLATAELV